MSIEKQLNIKFPIYWNSWPIEEDFAKYLINRIITKRPINIVELGSGTSTLIIVKTLEKLGYKYTLTSIDSDESFLEGTKNLLISEDVFNKNKTKLIFAPIKDININNINYKWYDLNNINFDFDKIDLLFVDGPVGGFCKNSRYPAIELMKKYIKEGTTIILHDAKRLDEIEIVKMWKEENNRIKYVFNIETERGGAELQF
ncbi:TPA: hypothetical protein DIC38_00010 [Candidatus Nomurabacteria bacterium]|nr:hypothetical protein [Candidatus Nomurabacteria bacterium]